MTTEQLSKIWTKLERSEKLEIIEKAMNLGNTNDGFLMLRLFAKDNSIFAFLSNTLENHLCVEAVSQNTLFSLFGENHDFIEEDAEVILTWMESQK